MVFGLLIALFLLVGHVMNRSTASAFAEASKDGKRNGILALELERDANRAAEMVGNWGERGRLRAAFSIGLDALFIVIYVGVLVLGCRMAADGFAASGRPGLATLSACFAWVAVVAGMLDFIENYGLFRILDGRAFGGWGITSLCAWVKWAIVIPTLLYLIVTMCWLRGKFFT